MGNPSSSTSGRVGASPSESDADSPSCGGALGLGDRLRLIGGGAASSSSLSSSGPSISVGSFILFDG